MKCVAVILHLFLMLALLVNGSPERMTGFANIAGGMAAMASTGSHCTQSDAETHAIAMEPHEMEGDCIDQDCDHACVHHGGAAILAMSGPDASFAAHPIAFTYPLRLPSPHTTPPYRPPIA